MFDVKAMTRWLRRHPLVCLVISLARLLAGGLRLSRLHVGTTISMDDDEYRIFRHITTISGCGGENRAVLIVRFKFARLSHRLNEFVSQFPMLIITGFPGFETKIYAASAQSGYWLGMYQWKSMDALQDYKKSWVLRVMNRRAVEGSVTYLELGAQGLMETIEAHRTVPSPLRTLSRESH